MLKFSTRREDSQAWASRAVLLGVLLATTSMRALAAGHETVLHRFKDGLDGSSPWAGLTPDGAGNLYGTAQFGGANAEGTVFKMTPKPKGGWSFTPIYQLSGLASEGGAFPEDAPTFDSQGNLYVTTGTSGPSATPYGAIFQLVPGQNNSWSIGKTFAFNGNGSNGEGGNGAHPLASVIVDAQGNLYGTASVGGVGNSGTGYGTVFELTPSGNSWTETTIHTFTGGDDGAFPGSSLIMDARGDLYGTTPDGGSLNEGVVFKMSKDAKGQWKETALHSFTDGQDGYNPKSNLIFDKAGNLYGTTAGYPGTVFELIRPAKGNTAWTLNTLYQFTGGTDGGAPNSGLTFDRAGNLYGAAIDGGSTDTACGSFGCGVVYKLTPTQTTPWTESVLYTFKGGRDGREPLSTLFLGDDKLIYGTTARGGVGANGVVFSLSK